MTFHPRDETDISIASSARMQSVLLGGRRHFDADRAAVEILAERLPDAAVLALGARAFLERAVHALAAGHGVRQFLDLGCGLPLPPSAGRTVHEIAQAVDPRCRVVYTDTDPIVRIQGLAFDDDDRTVLLAVDLTDTDTLFGHPDVQDLIRPGEPLAVLLSASLECLPDTYLPWQVLHRTAQRIPPGSFVLLSHLVSDDPRLRADVTAIMKDQTNWRWGRVRERWEIDEAVDRLRRHLGLQIIAPGLVDVRDWRCDELSRRRNRHSGACQYYGGVLHKPAGPAASEQSARTRW
ncbi:SAM-dependent methyltransferase [Kitasatospora sp. NPDC088783]|uniref:SAM-dependent methyltransferase n=1 Tax=Kitasatospora sp. NPDC088783 TaxID=3364077 RepID=UPI00380BFFB4